MPDDKKDDDWKLWLGYALWVPAVIAAYFFVQWVLSW